MPEYVTRYRTKSEWELKNPVLVVNEYGIERDTGKVKIGNGTLSWKQLSYSTNPPDLFASDVESSVFSVAGRDGAVVLTASDIAGTFADNQIPSSVARDSEVSSAVAALVASAPATLDTLNELAAAMNNDANFAATITSLLASKASLVAGRVPDSQLPVRLSDVSLKAALVPGAVYDSTGAIVLTKRLHVKLTADGTDIDDLFIETVA